MLLDLTRDALEWLELPPGPERVVAFGGYQRKCEPWSGALRGVAGGIPGEIPASLAALSSDDVARVAASIRSGVRRSIP